MFSSVLNDDTFVFVNLMQLVSITTGPLSFDHTNYAQDVLVTYENSTVTYSCSQPTKEAVVTQVRTVVAQLNSQWSDDMKNFGFGDGSARLIALDSTTWVSPRAISHVQLIKPLFVGSDEERPWYGTAAVHYGRGESTVHHLWDDTEAELSAAGTAYAHAVGQLVANALHALQPVPTLD